MPAGPAIEITERPPPVSLLHPIRRLRHVAAISAQLEPQPRGKHAIRPEEAHLQIRASDLIAARKDPR